MSDRIGNDSKTFIKEGGAVAKAKEERLKREALAKAEKEAKKKQKVVEVKGMQLSMNIADNDMQFKAKNVRKFLANGDKVKVYIESNARHFGIAIDETIIEQ